MRIPRRDQDKRFSAARRPGRHRRRWRRQLAALLPGAALCLAAAAAPALAPLPRSLERRMAELVKTAEHYRGLQMERRVPWGLVSEAELRRQVVADFREDLPPARVAAVEESLKAFGLIPESMDLAAYYPSLLTSQIAGFYDAHRKVLAVVAHQGSLLGRQATAQFGAKLVRRMEDGLLVHELTHALQDQHFDLNHLDDPDPLSDGGVGKLALVEGDASLVMLDDLVQVPLEQLPQAGDLLTRMLGSLGGDSPGGGNLPGEREMAEAPRWFRDTLLFSYAQGAAFCLEVRRHGGQQLLDYAFAADPPRSSEQILHPEKWFGRRDDPVVILWPDLTAALPGAAKVGEGQLGEEGIRILLTGATGASGAKGAAPANGEAAATAGEGWGGDRFAVYRRDGRRILAWVADWDTPADADRFQAAAARLGAGWTVARANPRRVSVLRASPGAGAVGAGASLATASAAERAAILDLLATARSEQPANRPIDLAHVAPKLTGRVEAAPPGGGAAPVPPRPPAASATPPP
jgi:hypothetical protein